MRREEKQEYVASRKAKGGEDHRMSQCSLVLDARRGQRGQNGEVSTGGGEQQEFVDELGEKIHSVKYRRGCSGMNCERVEGGEVETMNVEKSYV